MENDNRESFIFYRSFKDSINDLSDSDKLIIYEAITEYGLNHVEPQLKGFPKALFSLIKPQLDANFKRWKSGFKGGAPKGSKNNPNGRPKKTKNTTKNKPLSNQYLTNNKANVNVNVNVNDNVNDNVKKKSKKEILSFSDRQKSFKEDLIQYVELYGKDMVRSFYDYWSEPTQTGIEKMRFELERTWKVESRLRTWQRRANNGK
jgi:hypothetical protein